MTDQGPYGSQNSPYTRNPDGPLAPGAYGGGQQHPEGTAGGYPGGGLLPTPEVGVEPPASTYTAAMGGGSTSALGTRYSDTVEAVGVEYGRLAAQTQADRLGGSMAAFAPGEGSGAGTHAGDGTGRRRADAGPE